MKLFGIKFYNPFKPHIVVDAFGVYWVRKYELLNGWQYYDGNSFWCHKIHARGGCAFSLYWIIEKLKKTQSTLITEKERIKKQKTPDKVVHGY